jgi:hypothetical protein
MSHGLEDVMSRKVAEDICSRVLLDEKPLPATGTKNPFIAEIQGVRKAHRWWVYVYVVLGDTHQVKARVKHVVGPRSHI